MKGTYCLIIEVEKESTINVGKLGQIDFKPGFYVYVGSALNSLESRVKRHLSDNKKIHWHVDHLLTNPNSNIKEVIFYVGDEKIECSLASLISNSAISMPNFGCSDCKCKSHLFFFNKYHNALNTVLSSFKELNLTPHDLSDFNQLLETKNEIMKNKNGNKNENKNEN